MTTPERPSLADTIARIDAALAERAPGSGPTIAEINDVREPLGLPRLEPVPSDPVTRDGNTFTVTVPAGYELIRPRGGITENGHVLPWPPYLQPALDEAARHLPGPPGPTCPGCEADAARPGWLARALRRLFT